MITAETLIPMIEHWLTSEVNGYFGSPYGPNLNSLLLREMSAPVADEFLEKLKSDIPVLQQLNDNDLSLQSEDQGFEKKIMYLVIGDIAINLNKIAENQPQSGGTFDVDAG